MAVMGFLRDRAGKIVAATIGVSLFAFLATEVITSGRSFWKGSGNDVGEVDGDRISIQDFNTRVDQNSANFKQQSGQNSLNPQILAYVQETTWNQLLSYHILQHEVDKLGLVVGEDEVKSMISGSNPSPQIIQNFSNPQTGQFDRNSLNNFLSSLQMAKPDDPIKKEWSDFVNQMIDSKKDQKYLALVRNGLYVNSLEANDDYLAKNKLVNFKFVGLPYSSIADSKITLTDDDYSKYYDEHKNEFKNKEELRSFDYVVFDASPTKEDSAAVKDQLTKLLPEFTKSDNDSLYVAINADTKTPLAYKKKGQLEAKLDTLMFNAPKGYVYGPYFSNGAYKIAKLVESKSSFDSVKTSHILFNPNQEGGLEKALAKADSVKKLIQGGKSFAEMAQMYSTDKGSAQKGGDIPAFDINGSMGPQGGTITPEYVSAAFKGKTGDLVVATSKFGVHLIQIKEQKGSSKIVKVAVIDKALTPSSKTQTIAYSKAQAFLAALTAGGFDNEVIKENLVKKTADDVKGTEASVGQLDNARDLVRWAFNKANVGDFTDQVYQLGYQNIVATLTGVKPVGILPLSAVKKQIQPMVLNAVKAKQLTDKLNSALNGSSTIDQVAQKAGSAVTPIQNIVFANPVIPASGQENKLIGAVFGSKVGKLSKPIEGDKGVYVYEVDGFNDPAPLTNSLRQREQLGQALAQRSENGIMEALKDKGNVKDYRAKVL